MFLRLKTKNQRQSLKVAFLMLSSHSPPPVRQCYKFFFLNSSQIGFLYCVYCFLGICVWMLICPAFNRSSDYSKFSYPKNCPLWLFSCSKSNLCEVWSEHNCASEYFLSPILLYYSSHDSGNCVLRFCWFIGFQNTLSDSTPPT